MRLACGTLHAPYFSENLTHEDLDEMNIEGGGQAGCWLCVTGAAAGRVASGLSGGTRMQRVNQHSHLCEMQAWALGARFAV